MVPKLSCNRFPFSYIKAIICKFWLHHMQKEKYPKVPFSCLNNIMKTSGARIRQETYLYAPCLLN